MSRSAGGPMGVFPDEEALMLMVCGDFGGRNRERRPRGRRTDGGRRSVKRVESGNGNFEHWSLRQKTRFLSVTSSSYSFKSDTGSLQVKPFFVARNEKEKVE